MLVSWILRFLLFLFAFMLVKRVLTALFGSKRFSAGQGQKKREFTGTRRREVQGEMVRDPQCGMHVAKSIAISLNTKQGTLYFCSEECRNHYLQKEVYS